MIKIIKYLTIIIAFVTIIASCTVSSTGTGTNNKADVNNQNETDDTTDDNLKILEFIAQTKLDGLRSETKSGFPNDAKITGYFPIYTPGVGGPSYYEFKVKSGDNDCGYILVSNTEYDIMVPEVVTEGKTLTEMYKNVTGENNLSIYRYDYFTSVAEKNSNISRNATLKSITESNGEINVI